MFDFQMLINGKLELGKQSMDVINPANERVFAQSPVADSEQLERAVKAAAEAFPLWRDLSFEERGSYLHKVADAINANAEDIASVITLEQGKPLAQSTDEASYSEIFCRYFADQTIAVEELIDTDDQRVEMHHKALGVVAAIIPWNFPLLIAVYKMAPALMAGNTMIIKPSPTTPLSSLKLGMIIADILPPGVVNVLPDKGDLGPLITEHPGIQKISFTGSTPSGKAVMGAAAATLKRITLELGGNDPAIVLDDVDVKETAAAVFGAAFMNSGQVCIALKRLYVQDGIYDAFCDELAALAKQSTVGDGMVDGVDFGPVQNKMQFDKVCGYIEQAKQQGRFIAGGEIEDKPGYFIPVSVVRDVDDGMSIVDEEPFGPVLPVVRFNDIEDVIKRSNTSPYGLGASVWSGDYLVAEKIASRLDSGTVWVNQHCAFGPHIPFPASKESGIGLEFGKEGLLEYTAAKVVNINKK